MQIFLTFRAVLSHSLKRFCHHSTYEGADKKKRETMKRYIFQKMLKINFTLFVCSYRASGAFHYEQKIRLENTSVNVFVKNI